MAANPAIVVPKINMDRTRPGNLISDHAPPKVWK